MLLDFVKYIYIRMYNVHIQEEMKHWDPCRLHNIKTRNLLYLIKGKTIFFLIKIIVNL